MSEQNTRLTPTQAIKLTGKPRQTIYDAMDNGELSFTQLGPRKRRIDLSEVYRWYKEAYDEELPAPGTQTSKDVSDDVGNGHQQTTESSASLIAEVATLRERLSQLETRRTDERHTLEEQIDYLKERIAKMDTQHTQVTALLEDQRKGRSRAEERAERIESKLEEQLARVRAAYAQKKRELETREREYEAAVKDAWSVGGLWRKLWGRPAAVKAQPAKIPQTKSA